MGDLSFVREFKLAVLDFLVDLLHIFGIKRCASVNEGVDDDADWPDVCLVRMSFLLHDLGCHVVGRPAEWIPSFSLLQLNGQSEVAQFAIHPPVQEDVVQLQVPMHNPLLSKVLERRDYLLRIAFDFQFLQLVPIFEQHF